jgi:hypothetical protein
MVTVIPVKSECSLCGTISEQRITNILENESTGLPDLDTRPGEPVRLALPFWVQRCPHCGYCAADIELEYPNADRIIHFEDYEQVLHKRNMPEKAREFLAWAIIEATNAEYGGAGWSALHAAWICDDAEKPAPAAECRRQALAYFARQRAGLGHIAGFEDPGVEEMVLADLCRRTGQFGPALRWVESGMARKPSVVVQRALLKEQGLAEEKDRGAHTVLELLN